jgi:arylsulfatase A
MVAEGMRFTQFYVAAPVCTPSRAALLTGRLPMRSGMVGMRRVLFPNSSGGLPESELTIAEVLQQQSYRTAAVGKWHLGHLPQHLPTKHGFDSYFGIPYSNDMSPAQNNGEGAKDYPPTPLIRDTEVIELEPDQRLITRRYTEEAIRFIEENRNQPFYLYLAHTMPHIPLYASAEFEGKSPRGLYGDVVEELDWSTGQILQTLRRLGLDRNTLVVFTSDNGPWLTKGNDGGSAGLLREGKGSTWEGGMRVPAIAWWPGAIEPGIVTSALATTMDFLPTAADLAGATLPQDRVYDGHSLAPLMRGEVDAVRDLVFYYRDSDLYAVRKGPWKMHLWTRDGYTRDPAVEHDPPLLYHLGHDPSEQRDVASEHPEVIQDLMREVERHQATVTPVPSQLDATIEL